MKFLRNTLLAFFLLLGITVSANAKPSPYYYQLKVYHFKTDAQEQALDTYLKDAYLPGLHKAGIAFAGVFKPIKQDTADKVIFVFIPAKKIDDLLAVDSKLENDATYQSAAKEYLDAAYDKPAYQRLETIVLKAFSAMPEPHKPELTSPKSERVYELRSYESPTEKLGLNKIAMFNDREMAIFTKLNFNAVFYGQVIAGSKMPNLMYLTTFNNKADRDKHWSEFGPLYKPVSVMPEYAHNMNKNVTLFLYPADYSDI